MINNDVLRSVRYMLAIDEEALAAIVRLDDGEVSAAELRAYLRRDDEPGYEPCPDRLMARLLDGLIVHRRGRDESGRPRPPDSPITNNVVLKKLRVAFQLKEEDLVAILRAAGFPVSGPEVNALFRSPGHPNYRACGDQFLRNFLKSLTARLRG